MIPLGPVVARSRVRAPRAAVWATVIDPELRHAWWPELHLEPRIGGAVAERWTETSGDSAVTRDASGDVDVWVEGHAIGFRWSEAGDDHSTAVLVTLRSQGPETGITVTETGFDVLPSPAERAAASQDGWQVLLADLVASVEAAVASGSFAAADTEVAAEVEATEEVAKAEVEDVESVEGVAVPEEVAEAEDVAEAADAVPEAEAAEEVEAAEVAEATEDVEAVDEEDIDDEAEHVSNETIKIERLVVEEKSDAATGPEDEDELEDEDEPEEPDFDTLIRGSQPK